jgi:hypothetical protein
MKIMIDEIRYLLLFADKHIKNKLGTKTPIKKSAYTKFKFTIKL